MIRNLALALSFLVLAVIILPACRSAVRPNSQATSSARDPLNAVYRIEDQPIALTEGRCETACLPGAVARATTEVFGSPAYGDLDGDGDEDAALLLVHDPGGSGTFYYVAAALQEPGGYRGTAGVLLGDRILPRDLHIKNGVLRADYLDRRAEEPMAAAPSVDQSRYLVCEEGELAKLPPLHAEEKVVEGWVSLGREGSFIIVCAENGELRLLGNSPVLPDILAAYRDALPAARPGTPLFMVLIGRPAEQPSSGRGPAYPGNFLATRLLRTWPRGNCRSEHIVVESPVPGSSISSPLVVRGRARGTWFFEGDFPLLLKDASGRVVAIGFATAQGEWMTRDFVPFSGRLEFDLPPAGPGTLILQKDNPSDLPQHDDAAEIPVFFR